MGLLDNLDADSLLQLDAVLTKARMLKSFEQRPNRIILVRHGESEGNVNKEAYGKTPDSQIALTERGFAQGAVAGLQIRQLVGNETVRFYVSPYLRARQTLLAILRAFDGQTVGVSSEPRLREQDFGNFQTPDMMESIFRERQKFGRFFYRFPNGEAGTDVFDRMASFITYLFRSMGQQGHFESSEEPRQKQRDQNFVLITHGLLMRIFCMCYLRWTVSEFEQVWNPSNCEIWVLQKVPERGIYELAGRWRASPYRGTFVDLKFGKSKKEPFCEHMRRPLVTRQVTPGAPDALDSEELGFLRALPGPRRMHGSRASRNRAMRAGDSILEYWAKDTKRSAAVNAPQDPPSIPAFDRALTQERLASQSQWKASDPVLDVTASGLARGATPGLRPQLPPLRVDELDELARLPEEDLPLSEMERELLRTSIESIDYLGDWADSQAVRDSIVCGCASPRLITGPEGEEFTCAAGEFTEERSVLHAQIVEAMCTSPRMGEELEWEGAAPPVPVAGDGRGPLAGQLIGQQDESTHVFIVVGVPGSGKDTVIKRYLRTLGLPLLDASADVVKEYLAAWGTDELSVRVRQNDAAHGPGKCLLHAQYLHRESILVNNQVVDFALDEGRSIILEKTLHDSEHVLTLAHQLAKRGCRVHLFGTHITPLTNWKFLRNRMLSGQAFGRYITKEQTISSLRSYHQHFSKILADPAKRAAFDSIHLYNVEDRDWAISISDTSELYVDDRGYELPTIDTE